MPIESRASHHAIAKRKERGGLEAAHTHITPRTAYDLEAGKLTRVPQVYHP